MTVINTNIGALTAQAAMDKNNANMESAIERLSTGLRINSAADDAAGIAISNKLDSQIRGLNQAIRNASDGQALLDTAEGAQEEVINLLQRLRTLAVQSSNDTNTATDRLYIEKEADQILAEINRIGDQTRWNGTKLLDGTFDAFQFQVGHKRTEDIALAIRNSKATAIGTHRVEGTAFHVAGSTATIDSQTYTVNGHVGEGSVTVAAGASAATFASSVNAKTESTGVSATAATKAEIVSLSGAGNVGFVIGNGTNSSTITTTTIAAISDITALRDAINDKTGTTNITAAMANNDTSRIILTHSTGEDIVITGMLSTGVSMTMRSLDSSEATTNALSAGSTTQGIVIGARGASAAALAATLGTTDTLTIADASTHVGGFVTVTSSGNDSGTNAIIVGTDLSGSALTETITGGSGAAVTTTKQFATVTAITLAATSAGNINAGFLAADSSDGAFFKGHVQFDSVRTFSVTSSSGTGITDDFTGGGTSADASTLLNVGTVDLATVANSEKAISIIDGAISMVDLSRAEQGAVSNRLDNIISNLTNVVLNTEASKSHILDADFAAESSKLTKAQILAQASTSMLAQANASKQSVLALLQG